MANPLEKAKKQLAEAQAQLEQVEALHAKFPDLKIATNRWNHERYTSKQVNAVADQVEFCHNCSCCSDSPLEARPYIEVAGVKVYSDPDCFQVGEKEDYDQDREYEGWVANMLAAGISQAAITKVREKFKAQRLARIAELQEELSGLGDE